MVSDAVSKGRSSSRKINFLRPKMGFWCLAYDIALELVWVPLHGTSLSTIGMHHYRSFRPLRPRSSHQRTPLRKWISSVNHCQPRRIQPVNVCEHSSHSGSSTAREQVLSVVKMTPRNPASEKSVLRRMSTAPPEKVNISRCCEETDL